MPGGDSNSRPTPNAFGAALLRAFLASKRLQIMNGNPWILFRLQHSLDARRFIERFDVFACYKLETFTQPSRCVGVSPSVLRQIWNPNRLQIRYSVGPRARAECRPRPSYVCQGGDSNSRPRAYESPALPLSYPGFYFG